MTDLLTGKTAVVTGGTSGIGRGISLAMADHGADIVVADLRQEPRVHDLPPTVDVIEEETDVRGRYVECDVTEADDPDRAVECAEEFGGIDIMVNNAGVANAVDFFESTEEDYYAMTDVLLKGMYFGCRAAAERMVASGGGSIINISSTAADSGFGKPGAFLYSAAKAGVRSMSYSLADLLGPDGIRVNSIQPGYTVDTGLATHADRSDEETERFHRERAAETALERLGTPADVGKPAVFLASDLASYVTAAELLVDGGWVHVGGP